MGCLGEPANVPSPCNWSLQSNMAKARQVQSCAYVGTLLSPQRLRARLEQRFFQSPPKRTFSQCDFRGSPELPDSLLPTPPPNCQRGVPTTHARDPRPGWHCPSLGVRGGGRLSSTVGVDFQVPTPLRGLTEGSGPPKQVRMGMGGRGSHMQTHVSGMPPPPDRCLTHVFSPPPPPLI